MKYYSPNKFYFTKYKNVFFDKIKTDKKEYQV